MKILAMALLLGSCSLPTKEDLSFKCSQIEGELKIKRCVNGEVVCYGATPLAYSCVGRRAVRKYF